MPESTLNKIIRHISQRNKILFANDFLTLPEKIKIVSQRNMSGPARNAIAERHVESNGESYYKISDLKIFYSPENPPKDLSYYQRGIQQVISESFIFSDLLNTEVFVKDGDVVLDLGANIGTTAMIFSKLVGPQGKVIAVEPVTHKIIEKNLQANEMKNVKVLPIAVSNAMGETEIEVSDFGLDSSIARRSYTTEKNYYSRKIAVQLHTIDQIVKNHNLEKLDLVKMDIEGVEELALQGAIETIKKFKPKWSISSYHVDHKNELQHPKLVEILKRHGYQVREVATSHIFAW